MNLFEIEHLRCSYDKHYAEGRSKVVLEIEHLTLPRGKKVFIVGESGIGKSTILETLGLMNNTIVPDGEKCRFNFCHVDGTKTDLKQMWQTGSDKALSQFRMKHYSFIFQSTNLMHNFTAYENVAFTRMLQGYSQYSCFQRTKKIMEEIGLEHVDKRRMAHELSGGQQQRLAFARAILPDFTVLFGDEPTGNLDAENAQRVMKILSAKLDDVEEATNGASSAIVVSHDMHLAVTFADMIIKIRKAVRSKKYEEDEEITYGVIDGDCVFTPSTEVGKWTNGKVSMVNEEFEEYLRK
jgi:ABC-type lipoprotein export system ATPase subunit